MQQANFDALTRKTELENKRDEMAKRLDLGFDKIETSRAEGKDVSAWELFWVKLLGQYERVCDELKTLG